MVIRKSTHLTKPFLLPSTQCRSLPGLQLVSTAQVGKCAIFQLLKACDRALKQQNPSSSSTTFDYNYFQTSLAEDAATVSVVKIRVIVLIYQPFIDRKIYQN